MKYNLLILLLIFSFSLKATNQQPRIEPPFWWIGMENNQLQLLVHGKEISKTTVVIDSKNIKLLKVDKAESPNYLFLNLEILTDAKPGIFEIKFMLNNRVAYKYDYELKTRKSNSSERKGFGPEDVIYLLMPDRFSNGNPDNDNVKGMLEKAKRSNPDGRHGGDMQGIESHLDYFNELGITALWINPLLENNMPKYSYHGYAITDFYKVDSRFGNNANYLNLVNEAHGKNLKIIQDMVFNHCASGHWWMKDLPFTNWINQFPEFTRSNYRSETVMDPHASKSDKDLMAKGWFDQTMPDLNQENPWLATYLIQNSIWWIESVGLDGIRMDTYPYANQEFMTSWVRAVNREYPHFTIVGETWLQTEAHTAYFQNSTFPDKKENSALRSVTDFPMMYALNDGLNQNDSWTEGMAKIYITLSKDFLYSAADSNLIFLDNHDVSRFASNINSDLNKYKMGIGMLLTMRGIPMIYYGTEIMMTGKKENGDGGLRADFPGGWTGDSVNVFKHQNLTEKETKAMDFTQSLLKFRNQSKALQTGSLTHYIPEDGVYVYFRDYKGKTQNGEIIMVIINHNSSRKTIELERFKESFKSKKNGEDIFSHSIFPLNKSMKLPANSITILNIR